MLRSLIITICGFSTFAMSGIAAWAIEDKQGVDSKTEFEKIVRLSSDTQIAESPDGDKILSQGEVLIAPHKPLTLYSGPFAVIVEKGAVAQVIRQKHVLKVRNLWDEKRNSLIVQIGNKRLSLGSGEELIVAEDFESLKQSTVNDGIVRRVPTFYDLSCGGHVLHSEIHPLNVMNKSALVKSLAKSSHVEDRALAAKMLKMAAMLEITARGHGNFNWTVD